MSISIITEPTIYLVGTQQCEFEDNGIDQFLEDHDAESWTTHANSAAEALPEIAGRLCYMSFKNPRPGGNKAYLDHILEVGHGSVLEHAVFNFIITGVSRSLTHELVRHRVGMSYSQLSQRYVDESGVAFVVPPAIGIRPGETIDTGNFNSDQFKSFADYRIFAKWFEGARDAGEMYSILADDFLSKFTHIEDKTSRRKAAREAARSVLPNCTETKIFVTANARALRHFFELRANAAADAEIRRLAVAWLRIVQRAAPNLFGDFVIEPCPLGGEMASTPYPKV